MSRKDRRRVVMVDLTPALLREVRRRGEGRRGLGDTMRLMLAGALDAVPPDPADPAPPVRRLPLQLPKAERARLADLQARTGLDGAELLRRCLEAVVAKSGQPAAGRGIVAPTHHTGD